MDIKNNPAGRLSHQSRKPAASTPRLIGDGPIEQITERAPAPLFAQSRASAALPESNAQSPITAVIEALQSRARGYNQPWH